MAGEVVGGLFKHYGKRVLACDFSAKPSCQWPIGDMDIAPSLM
ncbi:uncharacterized protein G2W53_037748 [Senna tora]|uniref:Uncharacterized protein n=1 Tax=Senna tora TaxID=362788 RepID=A0A834SKW4_9FABA|nr:uncharacterized protein G2W53_037748 [Senna tora]